MKHSVLAFRLYEVSEVKFWTFFLGGGLLKKLRFWLILRRQLGVRFFVTRKHQRRIRIRTSFSPWALPEALHRILWVTGHGVPGDSDIN